MARKSRQKDRLLNPNVDNSMIASPPAELIGDSVTRRENPTRSTLDTLGAYGLLSGNARAK